MFAYTARSYLFSPDAQKTQDRATQMLADPDTGLYAKTFEPSNGIHTRLLSRAIVLEQGGQKWALVQADLGGLPYALVQEVAKRIVPTGIDAPHILLSATHSHSSVGDIWPADNNGYAYVGGDAFDPRVFESVAQGIANGITAANARLQPARIGFGTAAAPDASHNRSFEAFQQDQDRLASKGALYPLSVDPTVTVMRVDSPKGKPIALWSNFAVHPTSFGDGNLLFSGDNAGIAARLAESIISREAGLRNSKVVDVWTNGAQGDVAPSGDSSSVNGQQLDWVGTQAAGADMAGSRDASGIVAAWKDAGRHMESSPAVGSRSFFFSFDGTSYGGPGGMTEPVGPVPVLGQGGIVQDDGTCSPVDVPGQGTKMPLLGGPGLVPVSVPVSFWRIGTTGFAAFPVELTKQMGLRIRDSLLAASKQTPNPLDRVVIVGLTNGYWSYTTTPEEYNYCGYEGSFTLFGREEGYGWLAAGNQLMTALLNGQPAPAGFPEPPETGFGTTQTTPIRATPTAGTALTQPKSPVSRYGYGTFTWQGGDPQVDAPDGTPFVSLQIERGKQWQTVATDDTFEDKTQRSAGDVWTETFQFDRCRELGTYRFHVTGQAVRSNGGTAQPYMVDSNPFAVGPVKIDPGPVTVTGGVASVRPQYPNPGADAQLALPRVVRDGRVSFVLSDGRVVDAVGSDDGTWTAQVGSASVSAVRVVDSCGNSA